MAGDDQEGSGAGHREQPEVPRALGAVAVPRCADRRVRECKEEYKALGICILILPATKIKMVQFTAKRQLRNESP